MVNAMPTDYFAHKTAVIEDNVKIGKGTKIWHHAQIRERAEIGENCIFGKDVFIDTTVKIGNRVKVQNRASVYKGATIEDEVFIGPHTVITNDRKPRAFGPPWTAMSTLIEKGASIGAMSTIICGITIGEYAMVGAGSVVTKDVPAHALVYGNPASFKGWVCFCGEKLDDNNYCAACKQQLDL